MDNQNPCESNQHNFAVPLVKVIRLAANFGSQPNVEVITCLCCTKCGQALRTDIAVNEALEIIKQQNSEAVNA